MEEFLAKCPIPQALQWPGDCYKMLISKGLSAGILAGSIALKLPQILNIIQSKSVKGISAESFYSEVPLTILTVMYNYRLGYPFISYGESVMVLIQNVILVVLLWQYMNPKPTPKLKGSIIGLFIGITIVCKVLPMQYLHFLPMSNLPLMVYSRMSQIISSFKNGTTGPLSSITTALIFLGSLARVFTTIQEVGMDLNLLSGFGISVILSAIQLGQIFYYEYYRKKRD